MLVRKNLLNPSLGLTKALALCTLIALLAVRAAGQADANAANPQAGSSNPSRPFGDVRALAQVPTPPGLLYVTIATPFNSGISILRPV